ncbi:MAG: ribonuclease J [Oscillospiraceae bacterium]|nr:ribonuclease J [Oscillospiraceae bacterium]
MSTTEEKKIKSPRKSRSKSEASVTRDSALDAAIAAAISAPKPPKKAAQSQKSRGVQTSRKSQKSQSSKKSKSQKTESRETKPAQTQQTAQQVNKPVPIVSNAVATNSKTPLKIIPLGGLGEIGENMTLVEYGNDIVIIDCGMTFPDSEMPGVDMVIPDFTYVEKNADRVRGVLVTHGHEDHIGGIPYLLKKINVPVYATRLTIGLIENKLKEHNLGKSMLHVVTPSDKVQLGVFTAEFIKVNHSIPDAVAIALHTPAGTVVHMGDFKVDYTPIEGGIIDLPRFARLGDEGVLALMSDSTNSERRGFTPSERTVGESFEKLFDKAGDKRIIIATFSSNIHRVQQIINCAAKHNRKVAVFGRSMINVIGLATELGYLKAPAGVMIDIADMHNYSDGEIVLITTGSQGEPMSALTRMATNDHRQVSITSNDFIIISARPIPGNEKFVGRVVNQLLKLGAEVVYEEMYEVHVSGHACQEEQKLIISLVRPKYFIPVHGEYKHLTRHAETAREIGIPEKNILIADVGNVIELSKNGMKVTGSVPAGKVMVDGLGVGDVGAAVLKDRKRLAEDGVISVSATIDKIDRKLLSGPEIVSKGFVYEKTNEELFAEVKKKAHQVLQQELSTRHDYTAIKNKVRDEISDFVFSKTKRRPTIIVTVLDI